MTKRDHYLLDTNICIALLRGNTNVAKKLKEIGEDTCYLSVITFFELLYGAYNSHYEKEEAYKVKQFAEHFPIVSLLDAAEYYAKEKVRLRTLGTPVDEFDLLIASTALAYNFILVTDNLKHFQRIDNLKLENWIRR